MKDNTALSKQAQENKGTPTTGVDFLDLPGWKTERVEERGKLLMVYAKVEVEPFCCEKCSAPMQRNGHVTRQTPQGPTQLIKIADEPIRGKAARIVTRKQKYKCSNEECNWTKVPPLPGICETGKNRHMTQRLRDQVIAQSAHHSNRQLAAMCHLSESTIRDILTEGTYEVGAPPRWLGVDEVFVGGEFRFVLYDIIEKRFFDMLVNNKPATVVKYFRKLPGRENVEVIVMDMSRDYRAQINCCRTAQFNPLIVADKFHVRQLGTKAFSNFRIVLGKQLSKEAEKDLRKNEKVFFKATQKLTPEQREWREQMMSDYPILRDWYTARLNFIRFWEPRGVTLPTPEEVQQRMMTWYEELPPTIKPGLTSLWKTINEWAPEILAYFTSGLELEDGRRPTNGVTESYNKLIHQVAEMGGGNNNFETLRQKVLMRYGRPGALNWDQPARAKKLGLEIAGAGEPQQEEPPTATAVQQKKRAAGRKPKKKGAARKEQAVAPVPSRKIKLEIRTRKKQEEEWLPLFDGLAPNQSEYTD